MKIIVSSLDHVTRLVREERAGRVISLLESDSMIGTPGGLNPDHHLKVGSHDIPEPRPGLIHPEPGHAGAVIDFVKGWDRDVPMVTHCWMGVGRSSAAACIALCMIHPGREAELARYLRRRGGHARPNPLLVTHADGAPGVGGRMADAGRDPGWSDFSTMGTPCSVYLNLGAGE